MEPQYKSVTASEIEAAAAKRKPPRRPGSGIGSPAPSAFGLRPNVKMRLFDFTRILLRVTSRRLAALSDAGMELRFLPNGLSQLVYSRRIRFPDIVSDAFVCSKSDVTSVPNKTQHCRDDVELSRADKRVAIGRGHHATARLGNRSARPVLRLCRCAMEGNLCVTACRGAGLVQAAA